SDTVPTPSGHGAPLGLPLDIRQAYRRLARSSTEFVHDLRLPRLPRLLLLQPVGNFLRDSWQSRFHTTLELGWMETALLAPIPVLPDHAIRTLYNFARVAGARHNHPAHLEVAA